MVEVEKTLSQTRVDYALYNQSSDVKVIIEAKPLGEDLNHPSIFFSLLKYAFTYKIQDIFLTDGLSWRHFTNFDPQSTEATNVLNIAADDPVECAAYLVQRLDAAKFWPEEQTLILTQDPVPTCRLKSTYHREGQMPKKGFTEEQIVYALRQAEAGTPVLEVCRKLGVTEQTFYRWKRKFAGLGVAELRRLHQLEEENSKLKQLVADLSLDKHMLQEVLRKKF
jgi:putative transposase